MRQVFFFFILFSFQLSFCQSYVPFPTQVGAQWFEYMEWNYGATNQSSCEKRIYIIVGDTVLDSMNYQIIQEKLNRNTSTFQNCSVLAPTYASDSIYLRNDTANKKVWIRFDGNNPDTLLYDFSLTVGDTLFSLARLPSPPSSIYGVVDSIDTVSYGGVKRLRFLFQPNSYTSQYIIEGIGGTFSFLNPLFDGYGYATSNLECFSTPSQNIYPDSATNCRLVTKLQPVRSEIANIAIYPNPTKGVININSSLEVEIVQLYNALGQQVQEIIPIKQDNIVIELEGPSGVYFMCLHLKDGKSKSFKLIKE